MEFYDAFAEYYDDIFKPDLQLAEFIKSQIAANGANAEILDVGCATGNYALLFAGAGSNVYGIDLSVNMIEQANEKITDREISFSVMDMLNAADNFPENKFSAVMILGNTLVHLRNKSILAEFINSLKKILQPHGKIFIQLVNYEHFIEKKITSLPDISGEIIDFKRSYDYRADGIIFNTIIREKKSGKEYHNSINIYGICKDEIMTILEEANFSGIGIFSNSGGKYTEDSTTILVIAEK